MLVATVGEEHFPATQEAILSVATALDEAQLQSGDQYLHEVKLMHVEAGFEWSSPLERQLYLCKRALKRHRGPEIRAKEVQIADLSQEAWDMKCLDKGAYTRPAWMYAMAVSWMLRACEATELRMGDLALDWETKTVALKIRKSKTDQAAKGTVRTLACCKRSECTKECPFSLAVRSLAEKPNGKATDFLFSMQGEREKNQGPHIEVLGQVLGRRPYRSLGKALGCHVLHKKRNGRAGHLILGSVEKLSCFPLHGGSVARETNEREIEGHDGGRGKGFGHQPHTVLGKMDGNTDREQGEVTKDTDREIISPGKPRQGQRGKAQRDSGAANSRAGTGHPVSHPDTRGPRGSAALGNLPDERQEESNPRGYKGCVADGLERVVHGLRVALCAAGGKGDPVKDPTGLSTQMHQMREGQRAARESSRRCWFGAADV